MPDEQAPASSTGTAAVEPQPISLDSLTDTQRNDWMLTGKLPDATTPAKTEDSAASTEESSDADADGEDATTDAEPAPESDPDITEEDLGEDVKPKARKRISQLLTQRAEWKVKAEMLAAQLAEAKRPGPEQPKEQPKPETEARSDKAPRLDDVDKDGKPKFKSIDEWQDARDAWVKAEAVKEFATQQAEKDAKVAHEKSISDFQSRADLVRKDPAFADFDAALSAIGKYEKDNGPLLSATMQQAVFGHPEGPKLAYYLAKHIGETVEIFKLPPQAQAFRLGQLIAGLGKPAASGSAEPPLKKHTTAPPPATDIGARNTSEVDEARAALAAGDMARYMRVMNAREIQRK